MSEIGEAGGSNEAAKLLRYCGMTYTRKYT